MSPAFFPPSQTTAWAIFSQDTRAAVLVLWPHPGPMWPGLTVGMGEGLAWQSWALVGGRDSSSRPPPPSLFMCRTSPWVRKHKQERNWNLGEEGRKDGVSERMRERGNTVEIDEGFRAALLFQYMMELLQTSCLLLTTWKCEIMKSQHNDSRERFFSFDAGWCHFML